MNSRSPFKESDAMTEEQTKTYPPHVMRMVSEGEELSDRIVKLNAFMGTGVFAGLSGTDQTLLQAQLAAMTAYLFILTERLARAKSCD